MTRLAKLRNYFVFSFIGVSGIIALALLLAFVEAKLGAVVFVSVFILGTALLVTLVLIMLEALDD